ncbi:1-acyl-sn-glycerol-3-phosphate acyltransferase [Deinococcus koreensis]|uniref:1-acyl-sn-glycerol-3-phosphate acyltransferase n=1 Tax=Deinococcus koreensis TaxID=2054903 RepID=A0A2K3V2G4_9DEIO|nr:1-acyl-sn-glycerol-3-phosphate acyltransferase [Deinococcus koreensis]
MLRASVRGSVRRELAGVWLRGPLPGSGPGGGAVLAPNHNSWWDGYLLREVAWWAGADFRVLMTGRQLSRFPFLRRLGALYPAEVRPAIRAAQAGAWVAVFPEGMIRPAGALDTLQPGAAWIARQSGVPLVPVGIRVVMRGARKPEAYLRVGPAARPGELAQGIEAELRALDAELAASDPEQPLAGYLRVSGKPAQGGPDTRPDWASRLLTLVTGDR